MTLKIHFVETGIRDGLASRREHTISGRRALHGMGPDGLSWHPGKVGIGKHGLSIGLLRGHAAQRVVHYLAVGVAKAYVGQAVHLVVVEGLLQVAEVVLSAG